MELLKNVTQAACVSQGGSRSGSFLAVCKLTFSTDINENIKSLLLIFAAEAKI